MLNAALKSHDYALYGFQVLSDLLRGRPWTESGHFPRVTLCDFQVRYLANLNSYTVQCALLINFINEKVFAFFWCWYLLMVVITSCSCMFWIINSWLSSQRAAFVLKFIHIAASSDTQQELKITTRRPGQRIATLFTAPPHLMEKFVEKFLNNDGVFTLRLMANHAGDIIVMQVVKYLWLEFRERHWREFDIDFSHNGPFSSNNAKKVDTLGGEEKPLATRVILRQSVSDDSDRRNRTSSVPPKTRQAHSYPPLADSDSPLL
uniref:Innexin n=1 Tax=Plectus sambesii TaxID=2011161 RepID=A0A914UNQ3_9BILA